MAKYYSPEYKRIACQLLQTNGGSVALTSRQTGIPPRTLREWRQHHAQPAPQENTRRRQPLEEQVQLLQERMMEQAVTLANNLASETDAVSLNQRIIALTRLVDRLMKLADMYPAPQDESVPIFRIVYVDEHGKEWDSPPDLEEGDERGDL